MEEHLVEHLPLVSQMDTFGCELTLLDADTHHALQDPTQEDLCWNTQFCPIVHECFQQIECKEQIQGLGFHSGKVCSFCFGLEPQQGHFPTEPPSTTGELPPGSIRRSDPITLARWDVVGISNLTHSSKALKAACGYRHASNLFLEQTRWESSTHFPKALRPMYRLLPGSVRSTGPCSPRIPLLESHASRMAV